MATEEELKEQTRQIIYQLHQAVVGLPGTVENGLVGDVKEIKTELRTINGRVTIVETLQKERRKYSKKAIGSILGGAGAIGVALWKAFTN
tara:strand:+ start:26922 stop:27191 length:270 start_codon:yes stop_codon:yes gene_type:complete